MANIKINRREILSQGLCWRTKLIIWLFPVKNVFITWLFLID
jgi:hypothetical protein